MNEYLKNLPDDLTTDLGIFEGYRDYCWEHYLKGGEDAHSWYQDYLNAKTAAQAEINRIKERG